MNSFLYEHYKANRMAASAFAPEAPVSGFNALYQIINDLSAEMLESLHQRFNEEHTPAPEPEPEVEPLLLSHESMKQVIVGRIITALEPRVGPVDARNTAEWVVAGYPWPDNDVDTLGEEKKPEPDWAALGETYKVFQQDQYAIQWKKLKAVRIARMFDEIPSWFRDGGHARQEFSNLRARILAEIEKGLPKDTPLDVDDPEHAALLQEEAEIERLTRHEFVVGMDPSATGLPHISVWVRGVPPEHDGWFHFKDREDLTVHAPDDDPVVQGFADPDLDRLLSLVSSCFAREAVHSVGPNAGQPKKKIEQPALLRIMESVCDAIISGWWESEDMLREMERTFHRYGVPTSGGVAKAVLDLLRPTPS